MKNARILLPVVTCVFVVFVAWLFFARTKAHPPVALQPVPTLSGYGAALSESETLNINTATAEQLQALPGIGSVLAERIIAYRQENGMFQSIGELMLVPGVGEKKLETIWDLVTTGG